MAQEVLMPQMGESIAEGTITQWLKKVGDRVERDEPLFEISTDKVDAEIPSPSAGVLVEIKVNAGQTVPVQSVVAIISEGEGATDGVPTASPVTTKPATALDAKVAGASNPVTSPAPSARAYASISASSASEGAVAVNDHRGVRSSPVVRKIAAEHGVDLSQLSGTGIGGRITKDDILAHIERGASGVAVASASGMETSVPVLVADAAGAVPEAYRARALPGDRVEELSTMRAKIAEHMVWSRRISPHVQTVWEVDVNQVVALRDRFKDAWREQHGVKLTYTSFVAKAAIAALKAFPVVNASLSGNKVIYHQNVNLGLAVALDWGLIVPVIRNANELNLLGLQKRTSDLAERARTKKLKPDEVQDGTFTITNPGVYGSLFGMPVINQPQVAILNVGTIEKRPVVIDDMIAIRWRMYMALSFDHRVVDGAVADQFMAAIKKSIEAFDETEM